MADAGGREVAVVGGGMFGVAAALELADRGHDVTLHERNDELLAETSGSNQWRLHRGYHYPRSEATARQCREAEPRFRSRFGDAVIDGDTHYYCVASEGSKTAPDEFLAFCDRLDLEYERTTTPLVADEKVALTLAVRESHVDQDRLRAICRRRLRDRGVTLRLGSTVEEVSALDDEYVVVATYANQNRLLASHPSLQREYEFEVCELPLLELPDRYVGNNLIVVDGPFMCVDHFGSRDAFLMGDYHHMVHRRNVGRAPVLEDPYASLVNEGLVADPPTTNVEAFLDHGREYLPGVAEATHLGSLFTVRAKLPATQRTAARPTVVDREGSVVSVFGGKLGTCVTAAERVCEAIEGA